MTRIIPSVFYRLIIGIFLRFGFFHICHICIIPKITQPVIYIGIILVIFVVVNFVIRNFERTFSKQMMQLLDYLNLREAFETDGVFDENRPETVNASPEKIADSTKEEFCRSPIFSIF